MIAVLLTLTGVIACNKQTVTIYMADGSLQCDSQSENNSLDRMQAELVANDIQVYNAYRSNDGLMHIQMCGSPTGKTNVFDINEHDVNKAQDLGFELIPQGE